MSNITNFKARGGKIAHLFQDTQKEGLRNRLYELIDLVEDNRLDSILVAGFTSDPDYPVLTGWANLSLAERATLISHMQADMMLGVVESSLGE